MKTITDTRLKRILAMPKLEVSMPYPETAQPQNEVELYGGNFKGETIYRIRDTEVQNG